MCLSNQNALKIRFLIHCHRSDSVFLFVVIHTVLLRFASGLGCARPCCQDSRVSETKRRWFADVLFVRSSSVRYVIRSGSPSGIILRIAMSTGLMNLDCSGVTTEKSAIWVFLLIV